MKAFLALSLASLSLFLSSAGTAFALAPGDRAPDFALRATDGTTHTLSQYSGKIVVLEWTNPTCPFVKRHYAAGTMKGLAQKYAPQGVVWLAIDSSHFATDEDARKWVKDQGLPYPVLLDLSGSTGMAYGAKTTPHIFVVGKDGTIAYAGAVDDDPRGEKASPRNYVDEVLSSLVAGKTVTLTSTQPYGCSVKYKK